MNNRIEPEDDIAVINTELILADLETLAKRKIKTAKEARGGDKDAPIELALMERLERELRGCPGAPDPLVPHRRKRAENGARITVAYR